MSINISRSIGSKALFMVVIFIGGLASAIGQADSLSKEIKESISKIENLYPNYKVDEQYFTPLGDSKSGAELNSIELRGKKHFSGSFVRLCDGGDYWIAWHGRDLATWNKAKDCRGFGKSTKDQAPIEVNINASWLLYNKESGDLNTERFWLAELANAPKVDAKPIKYFVSMLDPLMDRPFEGFYEWKRNPMKFCPQITDIDTQALFKKYGKHAPSTEAPYVFKEGDSIEQILFNFGTPKSVNETSNGKNQDVFLHYENDMMFYFTNGKLKKWTNVR